MVFNLLHWQKQCLLRHNHLVPFCKFYVKAIITGFWFLLLDVHQKLNGHLSSKNKKVVADILRCKSDAIVLEHTQVQYQIGTSDCGLFAIAFAASICNSEDPGKVLFHQNSLRSHLKVCLENGEITQFPRKGT